MVPDIDGPGIDVAQPSDAVDTWRPSDTNHTAQTISELDVVCAWDMARVL